jgi:hypothetical protein
MIYQRFLNIIIILFLCKVCVGQILENSNPDSNQVEPGLFFFDEKKLADYQDSLKRVYRCDLLTGYISTYIYVNIGILNFNCRINDTILLQGSTDSLGRFFILTEKYHPSKIEFQISDKNYFDFDTTLYIEKEISLPFLFELKPRYRILLKGRSLAGTLPIDGADVEIVHLTDTFRVKTLSCYYDDENYWNCLYLGMFKQNIVFTDPSDTVSISVSKTGFKTKKLALQCNEYDGSMLDIKLKYSTILPKLNRSNISLRITPPFFNHFLVSLDFSHAPDVLSKRLSVGIGGSMLISNVSTKFKTFRTITGSTDTSFIVSTADSAYLSTNVGPTISYFFTNPMNRDYGVYAGIFVPYYFQSKKFEFQPYVGSRFYLDLNKAFMVELRYLTYSLDVAHYTFNPYGNAFRRTEKQTFNKLLLNVGLQVNF